MPAAARIGDPISCGDTICQGSPNVFCNNIPWTRNVTVPDLTCGHCFNPTPMVSGSTNVFVNGHLVIRVTDPIIPHTCPPVTHGGNVAAGSPDVFANGL